MFIVAHKLAFSCNVLLFIYCIHGDMGRGSEWEDMGQEGVDQGHKRDRIGSNSTRPALTLFLGLICLHGSQHQLVPVISLVQV